MLQISLELQQEGTQLLERLDHLILFACLLVLADVFLRAFDGKLAAAKQVMDHLQVLDVAGLEKTVAFSVLAGFKYVKLTFPFSL